MFAGLLLFVICWSGSVAVFSYDIDWLVTPEMRVSPDGEPVDWIQMKRGIEEVFPDAELLDIESPLNARSVAIARIKQADGRTLHVFVDPYTGRVTGTSSGFTVQRFFRDFHRMLFIMYPWGEWLVTSFSLVLLISLLSALRFLKRWWKGIFQFRRGSGRALWSELHRIAGIWSMWFLLVISITALWYLFEALRYGIGDGKISFTGNGDYALHQIPAPNSPIAPEAPPIPLDGLLKRIGEQRPDLEVRTLIFNDDQGVFYAEGHTDHLLVRDRANHVVADVNSGQILYDQNASDLSAYWRWSDTADLLHFGNFGGLLTKSIWCIFGLVLSGLVLTGLRLHVLRLARNSEGNGGRHQRQSGTAAAVVISLVLLAVSVPFAFRRALDYGPILETGRGLPTLAPGVVWAISAWVVITIGILAVWVALLWRGPGAERRIASK